LDFRFQRGPHESLTPRFFAWRKDSADVSGVRDDPGTSAPQNIELLGAQIAAQGVDFFAAGGCTAPFFLTLTDTVIVTIL
jgi:hypothetical protein